MGITSRMNDATALRENVQDKLYREERSYRADKLVEKWSRIPEVGKNIKKLGESDARNLALHLENQARFLSRLNETQISNSFQGLSPENMLRLVRLAYPNTIRNKLFTEFAMESAKDSIKYIRPVYTNTQQGKNLNDRTFGVGGLDSAVDSNDPWNTNGANELQAGDYRKAMYETTEDRYVQELANGLLYTATGNFVVTQAGKPINVTAASGDVFVVFGQVGTTGPAEFANMGYLDGYATLFSNKGEQDPLATQAKNGANLSTNGEWLVRAGNDIVIATVAPGVYKLTGADAGKVALSYGRFNSEGDFNGDYLGEVELVMTDYWFRPRPTAIGVTWSQLTELVLDTSFGVSAEELLVDYAGQEIKKALDFRAVKIAYQAAQMNPAKYTIHFDAGGSTLTGTPTTTYDSYLHTAQTFSQAIERVGDIMFNDINRGGVSRIVGGPAAVSYLRLNSAFNTKGAQARVGGHQVGTIYDIPVFKVPSNVIPDNKLLCIWKNDENEADVSIAFGTLVPFFSTGIIQRKNFYKEAALATYGDWAILNKRYLGIIQIDNIRTITGTNAGGAGGLI